MLDGEVAVWNYILNPLKTDVSIEELKFVNIRVIKGVKSKGVLIC